MLIALFFFCLLLQGEHGERGFDGTDGEQVIIALNVQCN